MALDCFGSVPFTTEDSPFGGTYFPQQASRTDIYDFCVAELVSLMSADSALPAPRSLYPRADKGSAAGLLARMYLNSEVYTGVERWQDAKNVCEEIFTMGYSLCPDYQALFRGDNGENPQARAEMLWAVGYNAEKTQSYGGTSYLLSASLASTDITDQSRPNGQRNGWAGLRVPYEYVERYFDVLGKDYQTGRYDIADRRGQVFYIKDRSESMEGALYSFMNGWSCLKFNNIPHDQTDQSFLPVSAVKAYSDVDFPMIRLGEIYLIYAEACMNLGMESVALPKLAEQRSRRQSLCDGGGGGGQHRVLCAERACQIPGEGVVALWLKERGNFSGRPTGVRTSSGTACILLRHISGHTREGILMQERLFLTTSPYSRFLRQKWLSTMHWSRTQAISRTVASMERGSSLSCGGEDLCFLPLSSSVKSYRSSKSFSLSSYI